MPTFAHASIADDNPVNGANLTLVILSAATLRCGRKKADHLLKAIVSGGVEVLDRFPGFETHDAELARAATFERFNGKYFDVRPTVPFFAKANWVQGKNFRLTKASCSPPINVEYGAETVVRQYFPLDAAGHRFKLGSTTRDVRGSGASVIIPAATEFAAETFESHEILALRIESDALNAMVNALLGEVHLKATDFIDASGHNGTAATFMRHAVLQLASDLDLMGDALSPDGLEVLGQALIVKFLYFNRHNLSGRLMETPPLLSAAQGKRIEEFIESRWDKSLSLEEMSRDLQLSARSIFRHFKHFRGQSPIAFQKQLRLGRARMMLELAGPETTVQSVALACGFVSHGRFSRDYRNQFGEFPSQTQRLAAWRGRTKLPR